MDIITTEQQLQQEGSPTQSPPPSKKTSWTQKSFEQRIEDLTAYNEKHGHIRVKQSEDKSLYGFCCNVRCARNNPMKSKVIMTDDRIASLDALGFDWAVIERRIGER